jgi:NADPH:quinone reductase-like Zn-dependent oxidoreductase
MTTMRAIQVHAYGDAAQLRLEEISQPVPGEGEVLVRVQASGVNALDWKIRLGLLKDVMPSRFPYVPDSSYRVVSRPENIFEEMFAPFQGAKGETR